MRQHRHPSSVALAAGWRTGSARRARSSDQRPATSELEVERGIRAGKGRCGCRDSSVHEYRDQTRPRKSRNPERQWQKPKTESGNDSVKPRRCRHEPTLHVTRRGGRVLCKFMRFQLRALTALVHRSVCPPRPPTLGSSHDRSALCLAVSYSL